ncbi:MAG: cell division protein FtsA [Candidatus Puniceispirillaceae bacterium]
MNAIAPIKHSATKGPFAILDIGSSKLACLIVETVSGNKLKILSYAMHASAGIQRGEITDLSLLSQTIGKVVEAAERKAELTIRDLHIVMPGGAAISTIHRQELELTDQIISKRDIRRLLTKQLSVPLPEGRSLIQTENLHYIIDGTSQVQNPKGMRANHLALDATSFTINNTAYLNIKEAVQHNHLAMGRLSHSAYAAGLACLSEEERDLGTLLLDMGGGTTSAALFLNGGIIGIATVPLGGIQITRDIARILSVSLSDAERLKAMEGSVTPSHGEALGDIYAPPPFTATGDNFIPATSPYQMQDLALPNGEMISRQLLSDIIRPRIEEILDYTYQKLKDARLENHIGNRVVLTGGASHLTGVADFISQYWKKSASLAYPHHILGLDEQSSNPAFAAMIGMALHISRSSDDDISEIHPATFAKTPFGRLGMWLRTHL